MAQTRVTSETGTAPKGGLRAHNLIRFALASAGVNTWLALLGLFTTPFILKHLGASAYGVFAMVSVVSSHLSNLELGFGFATVRYVSRARAAGDRAQERAVVDTSFAVFLAAGALAGLVLAAAAGPLVTRVFHVPPEITPDAVAAFRIGGLILACSFLTSFFSAALQAFGGFEWLNASRAVFGTAAAGGAVAVVAAGYGLRGVFALQGAIAGVSCVVLGYAAMRRHGEAIRARIDRPVLGEMWRFGAVVFAAGFAYQWMINGPPVILATLVPSAEIPAFSVPNTVLQKLALLVGAASLVFFPFASAASAEKDVAGLASMFTSHVRITVVTMGFVAAYLAAFGHALLGAWVSPQFAADAAPCLRWLAWSALLLALSGPPADVARGLGHPRWTLAYTAAVALLGVGLSFALVPSGRGAGAALAFLIAMTMGTLPLLVLVARQMLLIAPGRLARRLAGPAVAVAAAAAAFLALARHPGFVWALGSGTAVTIVYIVVIDVLVLAPHERQALHRAAHIA